MASLAAIVAMALALVVLLVMRGTISEETSAFFTDMTAEPEEPELPESTVGIAFDRPALAGEVASQRVHAAVDRARRSHP